MNEKNTQNVIPNVNSKKKEERNVPDLRFKFNSEWGKENIGNLIERTGKKAEKDELKYTPYSITNTDGFVIQSDNWEGGSYVQASKEGYKLIYNNEIAYNPARINVGSIGYFDKNVGIISSLYVCFKTKNKLHSKYLYHFMKSNIFRKIVMKRQEGGVRDYFFYENLCGVKISYPIIEEQEKIVSFLELINERISTQKKIINNYKSLINGLIKMYFPNKGLCEVGQTTDLNEILIEGNKISVNTKHYQKITVKLNKEGIAFSNLNREMSDTRPFYIRNHNEIIIGKQNYFNGSIAIIPEEYDNTICSNAIMSFKVKKDYNLKFIYYCISNDLFLKYRSHLANGTGQKELSEKDFLSFKIILPDENTQKKIVNNIEKISEKLQLEKKILFLYEQQKQYLLDKLFI